MLISLKSATTLEVDHRVLLRLSTFHEYGQIGGTVVPVNQVGYLYIESQRPETHGTWSNFLGFWNIVVSHISAFAYAAHEKRQIVLNVSAI